jgi:hypothetical protein
MSQNGPIQKRFLQTWATPLIPGLENCASFEDAVSSPQVGGASPSCPDSRIHARGAHSHTNILPNEQGVLIDDWLDSEEEKSFVGSATGSLPTPPKPRVFRKDSPSDASVSAAAAANMDLSPLLMRDPFGGIYTVYDLPTPPFSTGFSRVSTPSDDSVGRDGARPQGNPFRPVLADISKISIPSFVPNEWLALYQNRPSQQDDESVQLAFLQKVVEHFHPEENYQTPAVPAINFSPISMTPAVRTQARAVYPGISSSMRITSISSIGSSGTRMVRFVADPTPCTRHGDIFFPQQRGTPSTWPIYAAVGGTTPRTVEAMTGRDFFTDLAPKINHNNKQGRSIATTMRGHQDDVRTGWIPFMTPESFSVPSSSEEGSSKGASVKSAVADGGKENVLQPAMSATEKSKSNHTVMYSAHQSIFSVPSTIVLKTLPRRVPLTGKKLEYKRSDSEKNIMASLD